VLACGRVVVAPRVRAGNDASLPLEGVAAGADRRPQQVREPPRTVSSCSVCRDSWSRGLVRPDA
jgi:hypothetical protein